MRETDFHIGMQTSILIEGKENEEKTGIRDGRLTTRRVQISAENISFFFSFFFFNIPVTGEVNVSNQVGQVSDRRCPFNYAGC